jgi:hypothetical protein
VVVVVGGIVVVVVGGIVVVVVVVVGGTVVVVVEVVVVVDVVVVDVVVVDVEVVVVDVEVVVVGAVVVVVVAGTTGIDRIVSAGTLHVARAPRMPLSTMFVVSETSVNVIVPDAGAVALIEIVGVVSVSSPGSLDVPVGIGPGWPNCTLFATAGDPAGLVTLSGVVSGFGCACHCVGLMSGWWFRFEATSDL